MLYMCFISQRPFTDRVIKVIQYQKGLYDFCYTLVTLTTGYTDSSHYHGSVHLLRSLISVFT